MHPTRVPRLLLALVLIASALSAQTTGTLTGTVTSQGTPLPGVLVTISSPALQGVRTAVSNENGDYLFAALPPGPYTARFELAGLQTVSKTITVSLAQTARADAALAPSAMAEAITVTAAAPAVLETTEVAANYTSKTVDQLPMQRDIAATALLSPGVTKAFDRDNQLQISGAPGYDNLILVNGVVVNENLRSQIHNLFIEDAIQETTILSGGISAEYGRFTGGVVSTLTKSGGNEFSGSLRDTLTNPAWKEKTPWPSEPDPTDILSEVYEGTLGGFLLRDRLWFFGAGRSVEASREWFTTVTNLPFVEGNEETRWEAKLTGQITPNHNLVASYLDVARDVTNTWFGTIGGNPAVYDLRSLYDTSQPNTLMTVNYNGILTDKLLIEASYSEKEFTFVGSGAPTRDRIEGTLMVDTSNGNRRYWSPTFCGVCTDEERNNDSQILKATYYLGTASLGTHTLVAGAENFAETRLVNNHQSGSDFRILAGTVRDGNSVRIGPDGGPYPILTSGATIQWNPILFQSPGSDLATFSVFLNDKWELNDYVSFNLGVRYDANDATDSFGNVVSDDSETSPRLGVTWDVRGDGKHRVNATFGRYVSKIMDGNVGGAASPAGNPATILFSYKGPNINTAAPYLPTDQALAQMWAAFDAAMPGGLTIANYFDHPWYRSATIPGVSTLFVDPIVSPSMDEYTIGYGAPIGTSAFVRGDLVVRSWQNFYQNYLTLETGKTPDGKGDVSNMRNTDELERKYRGLHLQFGWRPRHFNLGGSYTYATLEGNDESEGLNTATSPNQTLRGWYPEYLGYAQRMPIGSLDGDVRHRFRVFGGFDVPIPPVLGSLNVSAIHNYASGENYGALGTIDASGRVTPFTGVPTGLGYTLSRLGDQHNYWFTARDAFQEDDVNRTDIALNYSYPIRRVEIFAQAELFNALNEDAVVAPNTTIDTRRSAGASSGLVAFNPMTETPVEGVHWRKGPDFGKPTGPSSYQPPREYRFSLGLRF